jgi:hypothetical protein
MSPGLRCAIVLVVLVTVIACGQPVAELPRSVATLTHTTATISMHTTFIPFTPSPHLSPSPEPHPTVDTILATNTAIVASKATAGAAWDLTRTALPTLTPSPTVPVNARACRASDLRGEAGAQGATGSIVFSVGLTNISTSVCTLQGPPQIQLIDQHGRVLDMRYYTHCFLCDMSTSEAEEATPLPATITPRIPTETAVVQERLYGKIGIGPGKRIGVFLIWDNWCQPFPEGGVIIRLTLPDRLGKVDIPTDAYVGGRCDAPKARSSLMVSHFYWELP